MHPKVLQDKPGMCPMCGMNLVPMEVEADSPHGEHEEYNEHAAHHAESLLNKSRDQRISMKLIKKEQVAQNIWHFSFQPDEKLSYTAGQFLEWSMEHEGADIRGTRRYFTLASSPTEPYLSFSTKIIETASSFKKKLLTLDEGASISAVGPEGDFVLPSDEKMPLIFIAGGIGVTPYRSMIKSLLDQGKSRNITLMYSVRSYEEIAFKDIFDEAEKQGWLKVVYIISDEKIAPPLWHGKIGMMNEGMVRDVAFDLIKSLYYVSGPVPMVEGIGNMLGNMGVPHDHIEYEFFPGYDHI